MQVNELLSLVLNGGFFDFSYHNKKYELISLLENGKTNNILLNSSHSKRGCIALCDTLADEIDDQYFSSADDFLANAQIDGAPIINALSDISELHRITT